MWPPTSRRWYSEKRGIFTHAVLLDVAARCSTVMSKMQNALEPAKKKYS